MPYRPYIYLTIMLGVEKREWVWLTDGEKSVRINSF